MYIEKIQEYYDNKIKSWLEIQQESQAGEHKLDKTVKKTPKRKDVSILVNDIRNEFYGKVLPLLNDNVSNIRLSTAPIIYEILNDDTTFEGFEQEAPFKSYLRFRLEQLNDSRTENEEENPFSLI